MFRARHAKLQEDISILKQQMIQKEKELIEFTAKRDKLVATREPLAREMKLTETLYKRKVVPEVEFCALQRQMAELTGELAIVNAALPRAQSSIEEARNRMDSATVSFQLQARSGSRKSSPSWPSSTKPSRPPRTA